MPLSPFIGTDSNDSKSGNYDFMSGLAGNDDLGSTWNGQVTIDGGAGNDYLYARAEFGPYGQFLGGEGNDYIEGGSTLNLDTINGGAGDDCLIGGFAGDGADLIYGEAGRDELWGARGNDSLFGGDDDDSGDSSAAGPWATTTRPGLYGREGDDYLDGGAGDDWLDGGEGNDSLVGGIGADRMIGGYGNDTYFVADATDVVSELGYTGLDTVQSSIDYTLGAELENLILLDAAVRGTGNGLNNRIVGTSGANWLEGGGGADWLEGGLGTDTLVGGSGNDTYTTDGGDVLVELSGGGTDTVRSSVRFVLRANFENLVLTGRALKGTGNSLANSIVGNVYANTLAGGSGKDLLDGGAGSDSLLGGAGSDQIQGRDGNDVVTGGRGADLLYGGRGRDRFVFDDLDAGATTRTADYIMDFRGKLGDRVDLKSVDANSRLVGDQAFSFIGTHAFTKAGQLRYETVGSFTFVLLNTDADLAPEAVIGLQGTLDVSKGWLIL